MSFNPYQGTSSNTNFYSARTEVDLRQELANMFDGKYPEIGKAQTALLRKMVRDTNNNTTNCECVDPITKEPTKDRFCQICYSIGKIWVEEKIQIYVHPAASIRRKLNTSEELTPIGLLNMPMLVFYVRYSAIIAPGDYISTLNLDKSGNVIIPARRKSLFYINFPWEYRCDNARSEYWICYTHEQSMKYLNKPTYISV